MASFKVKPEHSGPPELYYNETEAAKYASNSHITAIQHEMAERALELLALPEGKQGFLLDVGCGTGMSSEVILDAGHLFVGVDVSKPMLQIARQDEDLESGDFVHQDMGLGMPFRPGSFDGAISISAIQWLCHANASNENPKKRLLFFFQSLYGCLGRGSRAVFQFYPENDQQCDLIMAAAHKAGFNGDK
uniref:Methyltransf_11 domain-containing protein n=1 Tax=Caenorhabditis japonica TaxID=281687 RepID=A0A8R1IRB5_CAEJA